MRRLLHGLVGLSLLVSACGDDDGGDDLAAVTSVPDETSTSTTTTTEARTVAPDVIPQDESQITEEYVEAVLNELFGVSLEALLAARQAGVVEERALALLEATNSDTTFPQEVNDLSDLAFAEFEGIKPEPTALVLSVVSLLEAMPTCVIAEVTVDSAGLLASPAEPEPEERDFIRLLPAKEVQRASGLNPTAWVLDEFPVTLDGSVPDLTCEDA